jgi:hypothetical protein
MHKGQKHDSTKWISVRYIIYLDQLHNIRTPRTDKRLKSEGPVIKWILTREHLLVHTRFEHQSSIFFLYLWLIGYRRIWAASSSGFWNIHALSGIRTHGPNIQAEKIKAPDSAVTLIGNKNSIEAENLQQSWCFKICQPINCLSFINTTGKLTV